MRGPGREMQGSRTRLLISFTYNLGQNKIWIKCISLYSILGESLIIGLLAKAISHAAAPNAKLFGLLKLPKYSPNTRHAFSGKRTQRGLYKTATGRLINADTNGSMNIARKVIPNIFEGIEGLPFIPVVLDLWARLQT